MRREVDYVTGAADPIFSGMPTEILLLVTWKTLRGMPLIDATSAGRLATLLPILAGREGAQLIEMAILPNHVHVVVVVAGSPDLAKLAQRLKGASAYYVNRTHGTSTLLRWGNGYDARSISRRAMPDVRAYFDRQGEHHGMPLLARRSFDTPALKGGLGKDAS